MAFKLFTFLKEAWSVLLLLLGLAFIAGLIYGLPSILAVPAKKTAFIDTAYDQCVSPPIPNTRIECACLSHELKDTLSVSDFVKISDYEELVEQSPNGVGTQNARPRMLEAVESIRNSVRQAANFCGMTYDF